MFNGLMFSQSMNGWIELSAVANGIAQGMQASYNTLDRNAYRIGDSQYNKDWHQWQFANVTTALGGGILIGVNNYNNSDFRFWGSAADVWEFSAIRWVVSAWVRNLHQGDSIWHISENSGAFTENFNWLWRFAYLGGAILFKYFILPKL